MQSHELPPEALDHLQQISDHDHRQAFAERIGRISVLPAETGRMSHQTVHEVTAEALPVYGQSSRTQELMSHIAERAQRLYKDTAEARASSYDSDEKQVWDAVLKSELDDIQKARDAGNEHEARELLVEHMVSLELAPTGAGADPDRRQARQTQRAQESMLKIAGMGLAPAAIEAARAVYGLAVVRTEPAPEWSARRANGIPVVETHTVQSVAHAFEPAIPAVEAGLGQRISLDPEEAAFTDSAPVTNISKMNANEAATAAAVRAAIGETRGKTPEDNAVITSLIHQSLHSMGPSEEQDFMAAEADDVAALTTLAAVNPSLATDPEYSADFGRLRQIRLVNDPQYRGNTAPPNRLDKDIVALIEGGQSELPSRLITISDAEVIKPNNPERPGALPLVLRRELGGKAHTEREIHLVTEVQRLQREKSAAFQAAMTDVLEGLPIGEGSRIQLQYAIQVAQDPESALNSIQVFRSILGERPDPREVEQLVGQLAEKTASGSVLDEVSVQAEAIAPLMLSDDFRTLAAHPQFGTMLRSRILRSPQSMEDIRNVVNNPAIQSILKKYPGNPIVLQAIEDNAVLSRLESAMPAMEFLEDEEIFSVLNNPASAERIARVIQKEAMADLPAEDKQLILRTSLYADDDLQATILENIDAYREYVAPLTARLREVQAAPGVTKIVGHVLLSSGDVGGRSQELARALTGTQLATLIGEQGPAYSFGPALIRLVSNASNPGETAQTICEQMLSNDPLWLQCYKLSKLGVGSISEIGYQEGMTVSEIPLSLPSPQVSDAESASILADKTVQPVAFADMDWEQKRAVVSPEAVSDASLDELRSVDFAMLRPEYKEALLAYRLFEAIALSRDLAAREQASARNRVRMHMGQQALHAGDLVHATDSPIALRAILANGALAGEARTFNSTRDTYPFNLDTVAIPGEAASQESFKEQISSLQNDTFGNVLLVFGRNAEALHAGEEFPGGLNEQHRLILGGLPSTEIASIVLRQDSTSVPIVPGASAADAAEVIKRIVAESDMYIPVLNASGQLLLSPEEYDRLQTENNLQRVKPRLVDNAFRAPDSQAGSNEGAVFMVPQGAGAEPVRYYVKFDEVQPDHLWTEILADNFYRAVDPDLVAETEAVIIEGRTARASLMVTSSEGVSDWDRNKGFVMDAFLGNWDAVYNPDNIGPGGIRFDAGNSFDYRAKGDKKPADLFTGVVSELEIGTNREQLGGGMRQMYPGLTNQEIKRQITALEGALTDAIIDRLVDGVRLPRATRDFYKRTAKARRDYIINWGSSLEARR